MRALRYIAGGIEALFAVVALMGFGAGLIAFVQLSVQRGVNARMGGFILTELALAAVFGLWFGQLAVRNFRDAKAQASEEQGRR